MLVIVIKRDDIWSLKTSNELLTMLNNILIMIGDLVISIYDISQQVIPEQVIPQQVVNKSN